MGRYVRFVALGDSTTVGLGDAADGGWRGWARLLADALATEHDLSFCNLAVSGATTEDVLTRQVPEAMTHRADLASLIVGVNDTFRSSWDPARIRDNVLQSAAALAAGGATLLTVRFHDHGAVFGLPGLLGRPLLRRLEVLNEVYDEAFARYGGLRVDLAESPGIYERSHWSVDRLHPSELGHRTLAGAFAGLLCAHGLACPAPPLALDGPVGGRWKDLVWMAREGAPWVGRRARDLAPWAVRMTWSELTAPRRPDLRLPIG